MRSFDNGEGFSGDGDEDGDGGDDEVMIDYPGLDGHDGDGGGQLIDQSFASGGDGPTRWA